ncbi:MAG: Fe-S cluster assembly protein SufD [Bacteroidaceae bacterium]|nr:Fe-S cluster assembly protein SufD [Bacteroidaceae bacterium]
MSAEQQYIDLYQQHGDLLSKNSTSVLNASRDEAFQAFCKQGFPTRKQEKYRYTDISKLFEPDYGMNLRRVPVEVNPYEVFRGSVPQLSTSPYFIVNDTFHVSSEGHKALPEGVLVGSLKELSLRYPDLVSAYYGQLADVHTDGITAFNTAFVQDGFFVYIPRNVVMEHPLQLINLMRSEIDMMVNRRILVVLEAGAQLRLLACDHAFEGSKSLATQVVEVFVGANAVFDYYELEETTPQHVRLSQLYVQQEAGSQVLLNGMTLLGGVTRNTTSVRLVGEGASLRAYGMAIEDGEQVVDNQVYVEHAVPHCTSNQLYKYVLDHRSIGAFAGLVKVLPGAHHTESQQTNRNLCATREARMYTQPQLEIYNDDVMCSHGATVGQLDEAALFYMRQRGISLHEARLLLMFAFVDDVVSAVRIPTLRDRLRQLVELRFRGELGKGCAACNICKKV